METGRKHGKTCVVCGEIAYYFCKLCGNKAMHFFTQKGKSSGKDCFMDYHNEVFFGLALDDKKLVKKGRAIGLRQILQSGKTTSDTLGVYGSSRRMMGNTKY